MQKTSSCNTKNVYTLKINTIDIVKQIQLILNKGVQGFTKVYLLYYFFVCVVCVCVCVWGGGGGGGGGMGQWVWCVSSDSLWFVSDAGAIWAICNNLLFVINFSNLN